MPPAATKRVTFDRVADAYDRTRGGELRAEGFAEVLSPLLAGGAVLEVGVGTGLIAQALGVRGHDVIGVDISERMLRHATRRIGNRVVAADAYALPVGGSTVDNVLTVWVLQLVTDHASFFEEVARILRPGGLAINVASRGRYGDDDDIAAIVTPVHDRLRADNDGRIGGLVAPARSTGFELVSESLVEMHAFESSPNEQADMLERRELSFVWDLADSVWTEQVVPAIAALRNLAEPDRKRLRRPRSLVTVFAKPARG